MKQPLVGSVMALVAGEYKQRVERLKRVGQEYFLYPELRDLLDRSAQEGMRIGRIEGLETSAAGREEVVNFGTFTVVMGGKEIDMFASLAWPDFEGDNPDVLYKAFPYYKNLLDSAVNDISRLIYSVWIVKG